MVGCAGFGTTACHRVKLAAWIRPNPVNQLGSGEDGAVCDCDVTSYRFCLLESDDLPLELQLSLWARLPLPISAIIDSAGTKRSRLGAVGLRQRARISDAGCSYLHALGAIRLVPEQQKPVASIPVAGCTTHDRKTRRRRTTPFVSQPRAA